MPERVEHQEVKLGPDGNFLAPLEIFRGSEYFDGTIISGGNVSGGGLSLKVVSSPMKIRLLNLHMMNNEGGWVEVQFFDGGRGGSRVLGPYRLGAFSEGNVPEEKLTGRYFTSAVYCEVRSGWTAQPLSTGVNINAGVIQENLSFCE